MIWPIWYMISHMIWPISCSRILTQILDPSVDKILHVWMIHLMSNNLCPRMTHFINIWVHSSFSSTLKEINDKKLYLIYIWPSSDYSRIRLGIVYFVYLASNTTRKLRKFFSRRIYFRRQGYFGRENKRSNFISGQFYKWRRQPDIEKIQ